MQKNEVKKIVRTYAKKLRAEKVPFEHLYLFGSHAKEKTHRWSDIDVLVVTKNFPAGYMKYKNKLWGATIGLDTRIEPHACTVKDFKDEVTLTASETKKYGIKVV